MNKKFHVQVVI